MRRTLVQRSPTPYMEENMEIIRRECLWLFGLAAAASPIGSRTHSAAYAQAEPKLTQILRRDLVGQDHTVQETVASIAEFPTGSAAPWHMHPSAQEIASRDRRRSHRRSRRSRKGAYRSRRSGDYSC